jgi:hypothetical protein
MSKYVVLWFDDEYETLESISETALDYEIDLDGVSNAKDGIGKLKKDSSKYDAILLDGKFFTDNTKSGDEVNDKAFGEVIRFLSKLNDGERIIPWFVLSGQPSFVKEDHNLVELFKDDAADWGGDIVYDKNDLEVDGKIFPAIVNAIESSNFFKIKQKYAEIFQIIESGLLPKEEKDRIWRAISNMENPKAIKNTEDLFNPLRKTLESIRLKLIELAIIPSDINLNSFPYFLGGEAKLKDKNGSEKIYKFSNPVSPLIVHLLKGLIPVVQDACHVDAGLKLSVDHYVQSNERSFLYRASTHQLLEVLIWFKKYVEQNPDKELNIKNWIDSSTSQPDISNDFINGRVINLNTDRGFAFFKPDLPGENVYIPKQLVSDFFLKDGSRIKVIIEEYADNKTGSSIKRVKSVMHI